MKHLTIGIRTNPFVLLSNLVLRTWSYDINVHSSATWRYLAIYRLPDISKLQDPEVMGNITRKPNKLPGKKKGSAGGGHLNIIATETQSYTRTQTFEEQIKRSGRGTGLIIASMEPEDGTDADFDDWYRLQHLDMLS
jgi:hypothetical protein